MRMDSLLVGIIKLVLSVVILGLAILISTIFLVVMIDLIFTLLSPIFYGSPESAMH